jgi:hypothetical protein
MGRLSRLRPAATKHPMRLHVFLTEIHSESMEPGRREFIERLPGDQIRAARKIFLWIDQATLSA